MAVLIPQHRQAVLAVVETQALLRLELVLLEQQILAVEVALGQAEALMVEMELLEAPALSSCPIPCQKAQPFNSCLLLHGKHQQASLPLTTWW